MSAARGTSLAEALVALGLMLGVFVAGLGLYERSRRVFRHGELSVELQQGLRVALDLLVGDVRETGFGVNPDGDTRRPDEAIEAAFEHAIVVRADRDAATSEARAPEAALEAGSPFGAVSTGNDEIVGWLLGGAAADERLTFAADVAGMPRDGTVERITIPRVALVPDAPPYTLYRVHFDDTGRSSKTPVADGIRALRLRYLDGAGTEIPPPGGDETDAARAARGRIRRIEIEIEGVTKDASRKLTVATEIAPRNLGLGAALAAGGPA